MARHPSPAPARLGGIGRLPTTSVVKDQHGIATAPCSPLDSGLRQRSGLSPWQAVAPVALLPAEAPPDAIAVFVQRH